MKHRGSIIIASLLAIFILLPSAPVWAVGTPGEQGHDIFYLGKVEVPPGMFCLN